ncbi:MAG: 50S ribosomal protein L21e [Candidatus Pacearchaeota archaeon]|nr:50S ribosomal protein L21e [Candidatus Pacearchaeota archaeon]
MNRKKIRDRGKFSFSKYFQKFQKGESAAVVRESSIRATFPKRLQGKTGIVKGTQGKIIVMDIKDQNKNKTFFIEPIHLKKIKSK